MRRRYDTESLVGDLKREKRHAILLSLIGLSILVFLIVYFVKLRGPSVPEVPKGASVAAVTPNAAQAAPAPAAQPPPAPKAPPPPADAVVVISLPKPGAIFVDGDLVAKKAKTHEMKLAPGKHKVSTKAGAKTAQLQIDAAAGKHYKVELDPRKKKGGTVEETTP